LFGRTRIKINGHAYIVNGDDIFPTVDSVHPEVFIAGTCCINTRLCWLL